MGSNAGTTPRKAWRYEYSRKVADMRIASLAPNATSILVELGARRSLVGVSRWCADVAPVGKLPRLGDCWALDVNAVMRLKPEIVIGSVPFRQEAVASLLEHPVSFLALNPDRSPASIAIFSCWRASRKSRARAAPSFGGCRMFSGKSRDAPAKMQSGPGRASTPKRGRIPESVLRPGSLS